jgi:tetrahydromethanopterin S-methyltransferase subunit B
LPNSQKVTTYLDSLIRSLRPEHHSAKVLPQLEEALRSAGVHTGS